LHEFRFEKSEKCKKERVKKTEKCKVSKEGKYAALGWFRRVNTEIDVEYGLWGNIYI
jgi:hypothetical protein